jgi:MoaA/NifB/PqqE/SkfB family radical SAM enzyme
MKIVLIQCPVWGTYDPPVALAQLSACLRKEGYQVRCFDINIGLYLKRTENYKNMWAWEQCLFWYNAGQVKKFFSDNREIIEDYINKIIGTDSRIICFSVSAASKASSIELAKELKRKRSDINVVFGGPLFFERGLINAVLEEDAVDIVVSGEGEFTICELVEFLKEGKDISLCSGLFLKKNGKIINSGERSLIKDLDTLPFLDFADMPLDNYDDARHVPFMGSRGCIQRCAFCSSKAFWYGYRSMSGERIFQEIKHHKEKYKIGHIDFLDLLFNGDMKALITFCKLTAGADLDLQWTANMIIRPELTFNVLQKAREAGCRHIIYGIESGSQRVLNLMHKYYKIEDADKVIKDTHESGIVVTANFMFGFPGETEEDFQLTLDFIKRNAKFLDRVYPSRTFFALEEYSYIHSHLAEFGIKLNPPNHLYWESADGTNDYPERLRRCEIFCDLASSLNIEVGCGLQTSVELDKWHNLANYYEFKQDYTKAIDCYLKYFDLDSSNELISNKLKFYYKQTKENKLNLLDNKGLSDRFKAIVNTINSEPKSSIGSASEKIEKLGRGKSLSLMRTTSKANSQLNDEEYQTKKILLKSSPREFIFQVNSPSYSNSVFSPSKQSYEPFDLELFRRRFEERIFYYVARADSVIFSGSGEFLLFPDIENILDYFDDNFPHIEKAIYTDGSGLTTDISDRIIENESAYIVNVYLYASNSNLYRELSRKDNFHKILGQVGYLIKNRKDNTNPTVNLIFTASTLNIEDLPHFIMLASDLGVNKVLCCYNTIYITTQKYLSCFFKQDLTNSVLQEVKELADKLRLSLELPPRFGLDNYPILPLCRVAWSRIMLGMEGFIPPCQELKECNEDFSLSSEGKWLMGIWNSFYYQELRRSLIKGTTPCFKNCFRANPYAVNEFRSHLITKCGEKKLYNYITGSF